MKAASSPYVSPSWSLSSGKHIYQRQLSCEMWSLWPGARVTEAPMGSFFCRQSPFRGLQEKYPQDLAEWLTAVNVVSGSELSCTVTWNCLSLCTLLITAMLLRVYKIKQLEVNNDKLTFIASIN